MVFSSPAFFLFFLLYILAWSFLNKRFRLSIIITGSLFFYGYWKWPYIYIPVLLTGIAYVGGRAISAASGLKKTLLIGASITALIIPLVFFKYSNFLLGRSVVRYSLPLGISFITFTLISYLVDVFKRTYDAEKKFNWLLAYVIFFPQLVAGPILRPSQLLPQLKNMPEPDSETRLQALTLFTTGLVKKVLIADQIAPYVAAVYKNPSSAGFSDFLFVLYGFSAQVYCDFSGYSDMALGLALFFGIQLPANFNRPYLAKSITDYWRGWHITLTSWFRDYVYRPLCGKNPSPVRQFMGAFFTLTLCGIWHGAGWNFILWGSVHGIYVGIYHLLKRHNRTILLPPALKIFLMFHLIAVTSLLFPASGLSNALEVIKSAFNIGTSGIFSVQSLVFPAVLIILFYMTHPFDTLDTLKDIPTRLRKRQLIGGLTMAWILVIILGFTSGGSEKFIYFDF
jgi:D-alanyl-lipoteichoic acid acyltransferase DltB (MBOAT superfamily)